MKFAFLPVLLASASISLAANFSTGFEAPEYNPANELAGQNGWALDSADATTADASFFVNPYTRPGASNTAGALGGLFADPTPANLRLSHSVNNPLVQTTTSVDFAIISSSLANPGRDTFGFSFYNGTGANLLTVLFEPGANNLMDIKWSTGGSASNSTGWAVSYEGPYSLNVAFADDGGGNASFTASVTGTNVFNFNGSLGGLAAQDIASFGVNFNKNAAAAGDNYIIFDNVAAVPEPSTSLFALGALAMGFSRRRRK